VPSKDVQGNQNTAESVENQAMPEIAVSNREQSSEPLKIIYKVVIMIDESFVCSQQAVVVVDDVDLLYFGQDLVDAVYLDVFVHNWHH